MIPVVLSAWVLVATLAGGAAGTDVGAEPRRGPDRAGGALDGWVRVDDDSVVRYHDQPGDGASRRSGRGSGPGFNTFDSVDRNLAAYTFRLVSTPEIESYRDDVTRAATDLAAATGGTYTVAPGTVADRAPVDGEVLVRVTADSPCGSLVSGGPIGCGGPDIFGATATRGDVWLSPDLDTFSATVQYAVVAHEIGHALGLAHFSDLYDGQYQVMRAYADDDLDSYRSGDVNGLVFLFPPAPPANDPFAGAALLAPGKGSRSGTTVSATHQAGEPDHGGDGTSVWYRATAPTDRPARLVATAHGEDGVVFLAPYTGNSVHALTAASTLAFSYGTDGVNLAVAVPAGASVHVAADSYVETPFVLDHLFVACDPARFSDVGVASPFCIDITWMADEGITGGFADGTFRPVAGVTRQSMAAFLHRAAGSPPTPSTPPAFSDVPAGHPFAAEIAWLVDEGITTGYADGTFRPGAPVTRQAMSAFLYRMAGEPSISPYETATFFWDVPPSHPFHHAVAWMYLTDLSTGYPDHSYRPTESVTRQAMSAFLFRALTYSDPPLIG